MRSSFAKHCRITPWVIAAAVGLVAAGCKRAAPKISFERPPALVSVAPAVAKEVPYFLDEIGRCNAVEMVEVRPQLSGKIIELHFKDGAEISKGQKLFTIDARPFQAELDQATGLYNQRKSENDLAKQEFERVSDLIKTEAVSKQEYDQRKSAINTTDAMMKAQQAMIDAARLKIEYCEIKSPIDGRLSARMIDPGNIVKENETILVTVQRLDPIYADFTIAENNLPLVREYMRKGTLKTRVKVPGEPGEGREGDLTFLDSAVQQGAGTIKLRATVPNKDRHFWAGQYVDVRLVLEMIPNAIIVPARAIQIGQSGHFVYTVNDQSIAEMKPVTLGQKLGDWYVIKDGVKANERVILTGQMSVMPGAKVRVDAPATQQGETTQATAATQPGGQK